MIVRLRSDSDDGVRGIISLPRYHSFGKKETPGDDPHLQNSSRVEISTRLLSTERATGIEPASEAWEASILPMNYARMAPH